MRLYPFLSGGRLNLFLNEPVTLNAVPSSPDMKAAGLPRNDRVMEASWPPLSSARGQSGVIRSPRARAERPNTAAPL